MRSGGTKEGGEEIKRMMTSAGGNDDQKDVILVHNRHEKAGNKTLHVTGYEGTPKSQPNLMVQPTPMRKGSRNVPLCSLAGFGKET